MSTLDLKNDKGEADPVLLNLLINRNPDYQYQVFNKLRSSRLIGAIVARKEKNVEMMQALFTSNDGKNAMPLFTSLNELDKWNNQARPLPLPAMEFARQVIEQNLDALILDIAAEHRFVVEHYMLHCLANNIGWTYPYLDRQIRELIENICSKNQMIQKIDIEKGIDCDLSITIYGPTRLAADLICLSKEISEHQIMRQRAPFGADLFLSPSL